MLAFKFSDPLVGPFKPGATPSHPPNHLESFQYAPVFDSDDEYVTDDDSLSICSSLASKFSYRRRPIPVASKKPVSLIAVELEAVRADNIGFEDGEWEDSDWDNDSDGDYAPLIEANLAAGIVHNEESVVNHLPTISEAVEDETLDDHQATEPAHNDDITTCAQAPRKKGLLAFVRNTITGLKWCGGSIARLCTKPKGKQPTAVAAVSNQEVEADEEAVNPYEMFFGHGQGQDLRV